MLRVASWSNMANGRVFTASNRKFGSVEEWATNPSLLGRSREHVAALLPGAYEPCALESLLQEGVSKDKEILYQAGPLEDAPLFG